MDDFVSKALWEKAVGELVINYLETLPPEILGNLAERAAVAVLRRIRDILDDEALDDPGCALRIDAVVQTFFDAGLPTRRHREWE